jgi:hypothetical protein
LGAAFGGRDWGATSPKRGTNEIRPPNAQSGALWVMVWGTRLEMLLGWPLKVLTSYLPTDPNICMTRHVEGIFQADPKVAMTLFLAPGRADLWLWWTRKSLVMSPSPASSLASTTQTTPPSFEVIGKLVESPCFATAAYLLSSVTHVTL